MKSFLLFAICFLITIPVSDTDKIEKELDQLFFYIPTKSDKYEVRKSLHLNTNLSDIDEYQDWCKCFSADVDKNTLLKHFGMKGRIVIWFDGETKLSKSRKLSFRYYSSDFKNCVLQLEDLFNTFNPISYKSESYTVTNYKEERSGEGFYLFSTEDKFKSKDHYLDIGYRYIDASNTGDVSYYHFEIIYNENNL